MKSNSISDEFSLPLTPVQLNQYIEQQFNSDTQFLEFLNKINEQDKAHLIIALLVQDYERLKEIMGKFFPSHNSSIADITSIFKPLILTVSSGDSAPGDSKGDKIASSIQINPIIKKIIQILNPSSIILQNVMHKIPDSVIDVQMKVKICNSILPETAIKIIDYSYTEHLPPLMQNRYSGDVSLDELKKIAQFTKPDQSEFILLTLGYLQQYNEKIDLKNDLDQICRLYLYTQYDEAIKLIKSLFTKLVTELGSDAIKLLLELEEKPPEIKIAENHSRRMLENRLSQLFQGKSINLGSINRVCKRTIGFEVSTVEDAQNALMNMLEILEKDPVISAREKALKELSPLYKTKGDNEGFAHQDKRQKGGFVGKESEAKGHQGTQTVYSRNRGILKSYSPNFYDELSDLEQKNRVIDTVSPRKLGDYTHINRNKAVFGSGLSGHAYCMVAVLEKYAMEHKDDENLSQDINNLFKARALLTLNLGYHSFLETMDVFNEPLVRDIFKKLNIDLDLNFESELLEQTFRDAQEYSRALLMKDALHNELMARKTASIETKASDPVNLEISLIQLLKNNLREKYAGQQMEPGTGLTLTLTFKLKIRTCFQYIDLLIEKISNPSLRNTFTTEQAFVEYLKQETSNLIIKLNEKFPIKELEEFISLKDKIFQSREAKSQNLDEDKVKLTAIFLQTRMTNLMAELVKHTKNENLASLLLECNNLSKQLNQIINEFNPKDPAEFLFKVSNINKIFEANVRKSYKIEAVKSSKGSSPALFVQLNKPSQEAQFLHDALPESSHAKKLQLEIKVNIKDLKFKETPIYETGDAKLRNT